MNKISILTKELNKMNSFMFWGDWGVSYDIQRRIAYSMPRACFNLNAIKIILIDSIRYRL